MCSLTFYLFIYFTFSLMLFCPKLLWVHARGVGWRVFICGHGHRAKSDIQWAKMGRTVGQNGTYAGLKSDVWAKMQHWSVIMRIIQHSFDTKKLVLTQKCLVRHKIHGSTQKCPSLACISCHCHYQTPPPLPLRNIFPNIVEIFCF